jgi:GNAT superfamily N-acetyltransferase
VIRADSRGSFRWPFVCETLERMGQPTADPPRLATVADAGTLAGLLDAFNREYDDPTPGIDVLAARLERLLVGGDVIALLARNPATGFALLTLRPNVWYHGPVALRDELYVVPELRGRGLGSALLAAAEGVTRARGGELLEINVDGNDVHARRFYERHGYANSEPGEDEPLLYYYRELCDDSS